MLIFVPTVTTADASVCSFVRVLIGCCANSGQKRPREEVPVSAANKKNICAKGVTYLTPFNWLAFN